MNDLRVPQTHEDTAKRVFTTLQSNQETMQSLPEFYGNLIENRLQVHEIANHVLNVQQLEILIMRIEDRKEHVSIKDPSYIETADYAMV